MVKSSANFALDSSVAPERDLLEALVVKRLHNATEYQGTRMSLAIRQRIIKGVGGRSRVKSELGKASTFYITVPCEKSVRYRSDPENEMDSAGRVSL